MLRRHRRTVLAPITVITRLFEDHELNSGFPFLFCERCSFSTMTTPGISSLLFNEDSHTSRSRLRLPDSASIVGIQNKPDVPLKQNILGLFRRPIEKTGQACHPGVSEFKDPTRFSQSLILYPERLNSRRISILKTWIIQRQYSAPPDTQITDSE